MNNPIEKLARAIADKPSPIVVKRRYGTIVNVSEAGVDITLAGGEDLLEDVPFFNSYEPVVGDNVWVDIRGNDVTIVGSTSAPTQNVVTDYLGGSLSSTYDTFTLPFTLPPGKWIITGTVKINGTADVNTNETVYASLLLSGPSGGIAQQGRAIPPQYDPVNASPSRRIMDGFDLHAIYNAVESTDLELTASNDTYNDADWTGVGVSLRVIALRTGPAEAA